MQKFLEDVEKGLSSSPKYLPSKYFYDEIGDDLFVQIMHLPEYYLTRAELEIFTDKSNQIIDTLDMKPDVYFELIELGAGDGLKTKMLLKQLQNRSYTFDYLPIDISQHALDSLEASLKVDLPELGIKKQQGDYFDILATLKNSQNPKVILFLGSNIGNMSDEIANQFIRDMGSNLNVNDKLLIGVDLIKDPSIVLPAYNDSQGVTRDFNLNLLHRINKELGGTFKIEQFAHQPTYTKEDGVARSFLVSLINQQVEITSLGKRFSFSEGEKIATEVSRKYDDEIISKLIQATDFHTIKRLTDSKNLFANYIFKKGKSDSTS